ncbi:MAG: hypothetical protein ABL977_10785 [Candidatus Eisenbacteria bacterium]
MCALDAKDFLGGRALCLKCRVRLGGDMCAYCHGTGWVTGNRACPQCNGEGMRKDAPCPYVGRQSCGSDTCYPCRERAYLGAVDRAEALRDEMDGALAEDLHLNEREERRIEAGFVTLRTVRDLALVALLTLCAWASLAVLCAMSGVAR